MPGAFGWLAVFIHHHHLAPNLSPADRKQRSKRDGEKLKDKAPRVDKGLATFLRFSPPKRRREQEPFPHSSPCFLFHVAESWSGILSTKTEARIPASAGRNCPASGLQSAHKGASQVVTNVVIYPASVGKLLCVCWTGVTFKN